MYVSQQACLLKGKFSGVARIHIFGKKPTFSFVAYFSKLHVSNIFLRGLLVLYFMWGVVFTACVVFLYLFLSFNLTAVMSQLAWGRQLNGYNGYNGYNGG